VRVHPIARYQFSNGKKKEQKKALVNISGSEGNLTRHPCMQTAEFDISVGYGTRYGCSTRWEATLRPRESSCLCLVWTLTNRNTCSLCTVFMYVGQWSTATGAAAPRGELIPSTTVSRPGVTKYVTANEIIQTELWRYEYIINTDILNF
jgi:hypothetical protein